MLISIKKIIETKNPDLFKGYTGYILRILIPILERLLKLKTINEFIVKHSDKKGIAFIEEFFEYLDFSFSITSKDRQKIPSEGRLICVSNHPLGALDGLAIVKAIHEIRSDVKIVANDLLLYFDNLKEIFLPFEIDSRRIQRENIRIISDALNNEEAVIFFPSAEVSRLNWGTIKDGKWHKGPIYFAQKHQSPVLPVFVQAKNSFLFYFISLFSLKLSMLMLSREMFKKKSKNISIKIGDPIPARSFSSNLIDSKVEIKLLKKHTYRIGKQQKGIFTTEKNIISPVSRKILKKELSNALYLGFTSDEKKILLTSFDSSPNVVTEIARLRELTFRKVGEGTGGKIDFDDYDKYYLHLLIWDDRELEIVGAYRIGICKEIILKHGIEGLYTNSLFNYSKELTYNYLNDAIELGRSFIQKIYWNTYALDYLWQGIGAFLSQNPNIRYMFGAVSISNSYTEDAKNILVFFYNKWFGNSESLADSKYKFIIPSKKEIELSEIFCSDNYCADFKKLKMILKQYCFSIPTLYRQYSELCEEGGVRFLDFGIDHSFEDCIDGLLLVDVLKIKAEKKNRYINNSIYYPGERKVVNL